MTKDTPKRPRLASSRRRVRASADGADGADRPGRTFRSDQKESIRHRLIKLARNAQLFHDPNGVAYATVRTNAHLETYTVTGTEFRGWLARRLYKRYGEAAPAQALEDALRTLAAQARFDGEEQRVFVRLAGHEGAIFLDLANADGEAVEITAEAGWRIVSDPPIRFVRPKGLAPLPRPESGGSVRELRPFVNLATEQDFLLLVAFLLGAFHPNGPYPILVLHGEQGTGKSTLMRVARALIDPNTAPIRGEPSDQRDLAISASKAWVLAFDNLRSLRPWLSDALCRLATGGGFSTRALYTDADEILFDAKRPSMLTGIEDLAVRGDLLDRSLSLELPCVSPEVRRTEAEIWRDFENAKPRILGALLDAVSAAWRNSPEVHLLERSRMADFEQWVTAAEPALGWAPGSFQRAYAGNLQSARAQAASRNVVGALLIELGATGDWTGTATDLLNRLGEMARGRRLRLPQTPESLGARLRRLRRDLDAAGVLVSFDRTGHAGSRIVNIAQRKGAAGSAVSTGSTVSSASGRRRPRSRTGNSAGSHGAETLVSPDPADAVPSRLPRSNGRRHARRHVGSKRGRKGVRNRA